MLGLGLGLGSGVDLSAYVPPAVLSNPVGAETGVSFAVALPGEGETVMRVYRDTVSGATTLLATVAPAASYTDATAVAGTTYYYRVRLEDAGGNVSPYSNEVSGAVPAPEPLPLDAYEADLAAAYSLRQLLTSYETTVLRARRVSAELDIGFVNGFMDEAAVITHAAGSDAYAARWHDQSGNLHHVEHPTAAYHPRIVTAGAVTSHGGIKAIDYPANYGLRKANVTLRTVYVVFRWTLDNRVVLDLRDFDSSGNSGAYYLWAGDNATGNGSLWVNGVAVASTNAGLPRDGVWRLATFEIPALTDTDLTVGNNLTMGGSVNGHIAEVIATTTTRNATLEAEIMADYGIA